MLLSNRFCSFLKQVLKFLFICSVCCPLTDKLLRSSILWTVGGWSNIVSTISILVRVIVIVTFVSNKAKGRISKRLFQENISYLLIRIRNVRFSENLACFVFLKHPFWDSPFCLITDVFFIGVTSCGICMIFSYYF